MPGPGLWRAIALALEFKRDYLAPMEKVFAEYGDYVSFGGKQAPVITVFHPHAVEHVLRKNSRNYLKPMSMAELRPILGKGLLTSDGEEWKKHRQIIAPEFQHKKIESFFLVMQRHLQKMISDWHSRTEPFDVAPEISKTTYGVAGECFFGTDLGDSSDFIYKAIEIASEVVVPRMTIPFNIPLSVPLPSHRRMRKAIREMDRIVYRIIDERMAHSSNAQDVLSRLTRINSDSGAPVLSRTQIRDEVMTLLLAGHETSANALSWTLYLLGKHPSIQDKLRDEVMSVISGPIPAMSELRGLPYAKMVIEESMRLYPPAASIGRQSIAEDEIAGYPIAPNTIVNLVQWTTHRHPDFWEKPNEFIPERFANPDKIHPYAYFPFAAGPRECLGKNMAMIEAIALLAGMIRNFRFQLVSDDVQVRPLITIRPDPGVFMRLSAV